MINTATPIALITLLSSCFHLPFKKNLVFGDCIPPCSRNFSSPLNNYEVFTGDEQVGFWVTVLDSVESRGIPGAAIWYGDKTQSFLTDIEGKAYVSIDIPDSLFIGYIGFEPGYFYRYDSKIDSIIIKLSDCYLSTNH